MMDHERIRKLRTELGVSQAELARATGIHRTILSAFETGQLGLKGDCARRIRDFFADRGMALPEPPKPAAPDLRVVNELKWIDWQIDELQSADCDKGITGLFLESGEQEREALLVLFARRHVLQKAIRGETRADAPIPKRPVTQADYLARAYLKLQRRLKKSA